MGTRTTMGNGVFPLTTSMMMLSILRRSSTCCVIDTLANGGLSTLPKEDEEVMLKVTMLMHLKRNQKLTAISSPWVVHFLGQWDLQMKQWWFPSLFRPEHSFLLNTFLEMVTHHHLHRIWRIIETQLR
jgi:hypothetical protein